MGVAKRRRAKTIGEEYEEQTYAHDHSGHERENQAQPLEPQVPEVGHDERGLYDRKSKKNYQLHLQIEMDVTQENLQTG